MRRKEKPIVYVCSAIKDGKLIAKTIEVKTSNDAYIEFQKENGIKPQTVLGPFYKKKTAVLNKNTEIQFKPNQSKRGICNGWHCTAMMLSNPPDCVYLFYDKRVDGQKSIKPNIMIVKQTEFQEDDYEKSISNQD